MASVTVRNQNSRQSLVRKSEWDPTSWARELLRWDPFREMAPSFAIDTAAFEIKEIKETKEGFLFRADLPGVQEKDLEITRTGNRLTVAAGAIAVKSPERKS